MSVHDALLKVLDTIQRATNIVGRDPRSVTLVAVSKKQPVGLMHEYVNAAQALGIPVIFGENYVQELKTKKAEFQSGAVFHLLGPLQRNKIRDAVRYADVIESVHSLAIIEEIAKEAALQGKRQGMYIQVNIGNDPRKSGFHPDQTVAAIVRGKELCPHITVLGLMTITPWYENPEDAREDFRRMRELRDRICRECSAVAQHQQPLVLSMGMSADFQIAIEEGADVVRVGTALFGERL